ncbi:MAG: ankyrin repeat domain-containing protein [Alphaproteobacteria bacterium]|nr:ankyrin repeat domain-containing protein [Alphaproteobacteria bacterium]
MSDDILEKQLFEIIRNKDLSEDIKVAKIDMLNRLGVDVNAIYGAWTPLHIAKKQKEPKVIEFLTKIGAIDVVDVKKRKSLCCKLRSVICIKGVDINEVKELIDMGADVNAKSDVGLTALMLSSSKGHKEVVEFLIQNGANVNMTDNEGLTALMWASYRGHKEVVELLIKNRADVYQKDKYGRTALRWASNGGYKEIVELLIPKEADVNQKDNESQNAMMVAYDNETKKAIMDTVKKRNEKENGGSFFSKIKKRIRGR